MKAKLFGGPLDGLEVDTIGEMLLMPLQEELTLPIIPEDTVACGPCLRTATYTYSRVRPGTEYVEYEYKETRWP